MASKRHIFITGPINSGKTTMLYALCSRIDSAGYSIGGVIQVLPLPHAEKRDVSLSDQGTGEVRKLMQLEAQDGWISFGRFYYDRATFTWAAEKIEQFMASSDYMIIDEIGPIEMQDDGLHKIYQKVLKSFHGTVITVVRENLLDTVLNKYDIKREKVLILDVSAPREDELGKVIH